MQLPYHIKVSLQEYYDLFYSNKWSIPDFSINAQFVNLLTVQLFMAAIFE